MKWSCYLYILAYSVTLSKPQGTDEGCSTCAVDKLFEAGFEDWILPSVAGALQFLVPDSSPAPDAIPEDPDKQRMNDNPGIVNEPDIEKATIVSPDDSKKCDRHGDRSTFCVVATAQIIWPLPGPCGDEAQASRILNEINQLAPKGGVRSFHNKCGTWFFTASLSPSQIQQLMDENIGIKFIEPDVEMEDGDKKIPSKFRKRRSNKKVHAHSRKLRVRENGEANLIEVERGASEHKALVSSPPEHGNPNRDYAYFPNAGSGAIIYWIDMQFYIANPDLADYPMARLMAEGVSQEWARPAQDHGGCMLSIIGGLRHGLLDGSRVDRSDRLELKMVKVNPSISSFFSGIQAIITELELRIGRNERVSTWTVIGTHLIVRDDQVGRMLKIEMALLFQLLTNQFQTVVVVSTGHTGTDSEPENVWPANAAQFSSIPILVAASAFYYDALYIPHGPPKPFIVLNAPWEATCGWLDDDEREVTGDSPAVAIVAALAADMLTRPKVRAKLFIDNPRLAPPEGEEEKLAALRPVSAKIRDYLDSLAFYHEHDVIKCVWNGLDPEMAEFMDEYNP